MPNQVQYGFVNLSRVYDQLVIDVGVPVVRQAVAATIAQHNAEMDAITGLFTEKTTDFRQVWRTFGTNRLQPVDSNGRALPVTAFAQYQMEWPMFRGGSAWGADYEANIKMTVEHVNDQTALMMEGDRNWLRDHIFAALFANVAWSWTDEVRGPLTIRGLANGDTFTYPRVGGAPAATAQHYLFQAAAIADATNPYPTIYDTLKVYPDNTGEVHAFIPVGLTNATRALGTFHEPADPNIRQPITAEILIGTTGLVTPGRLIGYVDGVWIHEWVGIPAGYIVAIDTSGDRPLRMREDESPQLRGFGEVAQRDDFPYSERQYRRKAGFGSWNRTKAIIVQVGAGAYTIPTGFTNPMP